MAITEAKCPSCGAPVHITGVNQVCKCPSCGNEFIVHEDKTVNTNNFSVTQNIQKTIYGNERAEAEDYIRQIYACKQPPLHLNDYQVAFQFGAVAATLKRYVAAGCPQPPASLAAIMPRIPAV